MPQPYLSVVIPSYNEMKNFNNGALDQVMEFLKEQDFTWELILTDDGSTDGTVTALKDFAKNHKNTKLIENKHAGKAPTVTAGMMAAKGEWRLFTDFDQSTPLKELKKLFKFKEDYDVIIGSREMIGSKRDKEPWYRHLMGRGFNFLVQIIAIPGILDTQCGFKLFSAKATETIFPQLYVYGSQEERSDAFTGAADVELLFLAQRDDFAIKEVPIHWRHRETERISPIRDSLRMFIDILRIRKAAIQGKY